jgi:hypothetical protein
MKSLIILVASLFIFISCASTPEPEEPKGEYVYEPIEGFFDESKNENLEYIYKQSSLICENESMVISVPSGGGSDCSDGSQLCYMLNAQALGAYYKAQNDRKRYFINCMELKGFKRTWIEFEN